MFNRFRDSLVYPRRIIQYRKDRLLKVFGYILLFSLLMVSSTIVLLLRFDTIPQSVRDIYQESLLTEEAACVIEDGEVTCAEGVNEARFYEDTIGMVQVTMTASDMELTTSIHPLSMAIYFNDDEMNVYYGGYVYTSSYDDLPEEFNTVDFKEASANPSAFTDQMMDGFGEYLKSKANIIAPVLLGFQFLTNLILIMFVVLLNALILKMRFKIIPFKETFTMGTYLGTTLYILFIINGFFGLGLFMYILFLFVTFRQTNAISYEIMSRLKR